jgi:hypothetical protein
VTNSDTYAVGYRKPPKSTQFQKGQSGNPSGRPKKSQQPFDFGLILDKIENEEMIVVDKGKRKSMKIAEIYLRQLFTKAVEGNFTAAKLLVIMAEEYFSLDAIANWETEFMSRTQARGRFGKNWIKKINELNAPFFMAHK